MKLPSSLLDEMHDFFLAYKTDESGYEDYFSDNRKSMQLFVGTVIEQLIEGVVGIKPTNVQHARLLMNDAIASTSVPDEALPTCLALSAVLREHRILETKDYVEYEEGIRKFIRGPLRTFCQVISTSPAIADAISARRLAAVLRNLPDV